jgi:hypothetical protein
MASQVFPLAFFYDANTCSSRATCPLGFHAVFFKGGFQLSVLSPLAILGNVASISFPQGKCP